MTTATALLDTREMNLVHTMFRREFRLAGALVRRVPPGDTARAGVVGAHLDLLERTLHHHHGTEDALLWPKLAERVATELAPIVGLMEQQHGSVAGLLERIADARPRWARAPSRDGGDRLAGLYDQLYAELGEHLDAEEARVLPLVARCITKPEWDQLGATARAQGRRSEASLVLGMLAYEGDPEVLALALASAPPPVRWLVPRLARRAFRRHALAVHGTATP